MLTQRQAWLFLLNAWKQAKVDVDGDVEVAMKPPDGEYEYHYSGLCSVVVFLWEHDRISFDTKRRMMNKINNEGNRVHKGSNWLYVWPRTKEGAKSRVAFCKKMAARLKRKVAHA